MELENAERENGSDAAAAGLGREGAASSSAAFP